MGNVTAFPGLKIIADIPLVPEATPPDLQKVMGLYEAAAKVMEAKREYVYAVKKLWLEHPQYETVGDLLAAFNIDMHEFDGCL